MARALTAREEILARVRAARAQVPAPAAAPAPSASTVRASSGSPVDGDQITRFLSRVADYRAAVERCLPDELPARVAAACAGWGVTRLAIPADLPAAWRPPEPVCAVDDDELSAPELEAIGAALTGCAAAIAETGTLALAGPRCGRRALTLVPDHHLCVVEAGQVVPGVADALAALARYRTIPITLVSGPSASSDIELTRVEGVHGPRYLHVIVVG